MKSAIFGLIGAGVFGVGVCDLCRPTAAAAVPESITAEALQAASAVADPKTVQLRIDGMDCGGCALSARIVLERLEGVEKAEISYEEKLAIVTYDPRKVGPERMVQELREKLRFTATVVEAKQT